MPTTDSRVGGRLPIHEWVAVFLMRPMQCTYIVNMANQLDLSVVFLLEQIPLSSQCPVSVSLPLRGFGLIPL